MNSIATYVPTETSSEQEKEQFYNDLSDSVANITRHNFVVIAGDSSACASLTFHKTSPSVIGSYMYHDQTNAYGQYLVDFREEQNLTSNFHRQPNKKNHIRTREHLNMRSKVQIYHISINQSIK